MAVVIVKGGPDDGGGAADRDGVAKDVPRRAVVGQELEELIAEVGVGRGGPDDGPAQARGDGSTKNVGASHG